MDEVDFGQDTALMHLCYMNPWLLNQKWVGQLVDKQSKKINLRGQTALDRLLASQCVENKDFESDMFRKLLNDEKNIVQTDGTTALMHLCAYNP